MASRSVVDEREPAYVSTGHLPGSEVECTTRRDGSNQDGSNQIAMERIRKSIRRLHGGRRDCGWRRH